MLSWGFVGLGVDLQLGDGKRLHFDRRSGLNRSFHDTDYLLNCYCKRCSRRAVLDEDGLKFKQSLVRSISRSFISANERAKGRLENGSQFRWSREVMLARSSMLVMRGGF